MKYPLGIQTFAKIREESYLYVDKTETLYDLIHQGEVYFLSRPRRFGKSLLISTLEALFRGQKALFDGLYIADTDYDFATYSVVKLEFSEDEFATADSLRDYIYNAVNDIAERHDIELVKQSYSQRFGELVRKLHNKTGQKVVLLVDEYDKPILNNFNKLVLAEIHQVMSAFYAVIKPLDEHLRFVFITGVSKFAKISVFSGMNSLKDISMNKRYATLCGVTQQELETNFSLAIEQLANHEGMDRAQILAKIKHWYNGYRFHHSADGVYNPYSLLSLCQDQEFLHYWFSTGTPTFLINLIKDQQFDLAEITKVELDDSAFVAMEPGQISPLPVLLQTGYLTIANYHDGLFALDFPNHEVKHAFNRIIIEQFAHTKAGINTQYIRQLASALAQKDVSGFFDTMRIFFANIPFDITLKHEKYYQSLFYAIITLLGYQLEAEVSTNIGRIDCVLQTQNTIYIIEFKLNDSCEAALKQIQDKQYAQKYQHSGKEIVLLGVEFDQDSRNIGEIVEHLVA